MCLPSGLPGQFPDSPGALHPIQGKLASPALLGEVGKVVVFLRVFFNLPFYSSHLLTSSLLTTRQHPWARTGLTHLSPSPRAWHRTDAQQIFVKQPVTLPGHHLPLCTHSTCTLTHTHTTSVTQTGFREVGEQLTSSELVRLGHQGSEPGFLTLLPQPHP